jgi:PilZ domain
MDSPEPPDVPPSAVLAEVTCAWAADESQPAGQTAAVIVAQGQGMLLLEATDPSITLPAPGTLMRVTGSAAAVSGRLAEQGRRGRFLLSLGERPVRRSARLRVSLSATLREATLPSPLAVEIVDLTTGGARVRGVELAVDNQVTLEFTPPGREQPVSVRAVVVHSTHGAEKPWVGVRFRLVAMRGGR